MPTGGHTGRAWNERGPDGSAKKKNKNCSKLAAKSSDFCRIFGSLRRTMYPHAFYHTWPLLVYPRWTIKYLKIDTNGGKIWAQCDPT